MLSISYENSCNKRKSHIFTTCEHLSQEKDFFILECCVPTTDDKMRWITIVSNLIVHFVLPCAKIHIFTNAGLTILLIV